MLTLAGLSSVASLASARDQFPQSVQQQPRLAMVEQARTAPLAPDFAARITAEPKAERLAISVLTPRETETRDPFAVVVARADLSSGKLAALFARAENPDEAAGARLALAMPAEERFAGPTDPSAPLPDRFGPEKPALSPMPGMETFAALKMASDEPAPVQLAYAGPMGFGGLVLGDAGADAHLPVTDGEADTTGEAMPDDVPLPTARPRMPTPAPAATALAPAKPEAGPQKPATLKPEPRKPATGMRTPREEELAFVRPDNPSENGGMAGTFNRLFNNPKPRRGVAVYDISAGVVHMPDGSKLEAHSGIGKMVDNPKYVHVKMNGPTPPNTYKLSMREKRFHGVEAIRMTPVGGGNMHGRDGILAHSYLLRGGRAESHGCVAFKDYNRFLAAFKRGHVKHIVVVPSLGKSPDAPIRVASNARGI